MAIHTQQSMSGFIASDPQLTYTERGDARLYMKVGQEHYQKEIDGSFTQLEATFHDLVIYRKTAERAHARFAKGDRFVAEGYTREYDLPSSGEETVLGEEFIAKKIGHDLARTRYTVERTRRTPSDPLSTGIDDPTQNMEAAPAASAASLGR
ncbi:single-stranded DNA-binding protein [Leucobacter chromiireducens]|uniref:Single-stranded DNA-binding protein n=1 Tax=Leucobacter chromiireducens subsp. chromiireducens TaxID=660067 RepID=A0ABS1SS92_9MICO|nr:single-stranded DNA-binding protein [Leucobacter chromiireducens]MBL3691018.1 single-stranded DNA-binding protein [Leucobacter chromiireducens subsp. chromiireducens]